MNERILMYTTSRYPPGGLYRTNDDAPSRHFFKNTKNGKRYVLITPKVRTFWKGYVYSPRDIMDHGHLMLRKNGQDKELDGEFTPVRISLF